MDFKSFFTDTQPDLQIIDAAADQETLAGAGVDMDGYDGVIFLATVLKGEEATFTLKVQQDSASNFGSAKDLDGAEVEIDIATNTDGFGFIEVKKPQRRYVRPTLVCPNVGTAKSIAIVSIRYGKKYLPETNADGVLLVSPAEAA